MYLLEKIQDILDKAYEKNKRSRGEGPSEHFEEWRDCSSAPWGIYLLKYKWDLDKVLPFVQVDTMILEKSNYEIEEISYNKQIPKYIKYLRREFNKDTYKAKWLEWYENKHNKE